MKFIDSAGYTFCLRLKKNIKVFIYDKKEGHKIWKWLDEIPNYKWHSVCYDDILLTDDKYSCKLVYSKRNGTNDPWIIATNGDYKHTIIDLVVLKLYLKIKSLTVFTLSLLTMLLKNLLLLCIL